MVPGLIVSILSTRLALLVAGMAVAVPIVWAIWRGVRGGRKWWTRLLRGVGTLLVVLLAQILALSAVFLHVNQTYGFYGSWSQLMGETNVVPDHDLVPIPRTEVKRIPISRDNIHPDGLLSGIMMPGTDARNSRVPVWLPPQYFEKSQSRTRFPVLYWIGGLGDTGERDDISVPLVGPALSLVKSAKVTPFVIVFLPGVIRTGVDTECVDGVVPHQTWIMRTAMSRVEKHFRVSRSRGARFVAGWSSGGYCAANLLTKYPSTFSAGFSLAGYYHPTFEGNTLSMARQNIIDANSPIHLVRTGRVPKNIHLLSVLSKTDTQSWGKAAGPEHAHGQIWADSSEFYSLARGMKQFSFIILPSGGHLPSTYAPYATQCLEWLGQYGL